MTGSCSHSIWSFSDQTKIVVVARVKKSFYFYFCVFVGRALISPNLLKNTPVHPLCNLLPVTSLQSHLIHVSYNFITAGVNDPIIASIELSAVFQICFPCKIILWFATTAFYAAFLSAIHDWLCSSMFAIEIGYLCG